MEIDSAAFHAAGGWVAPLLYRSQGPGGSRDFPWGPFLVTGCARRRIRRGRPRRVARRGRGPRMLGGLDRATVGTDERMPG